MSTFNFKGEFIICETRPGATVKLVYDYPTSLAGYTIRFLVDDVLRDSYTVTGSRLEALITPEILASLPPGGALHSVAVIPPDGEPDALSYGPVYCTGPRI